MVPLQHAEVCSQAVCGGARERVGMRRRTSTGESWRTDTASPGAGGNTCNGIDEPLDQRCFPNWMQNVWS